MPIGKSLRFEVFARDGFTCQYCGARPPDVILEVDHIHPVSKGGCDEIINLTTSCYNCNRGKRAKVLSEISPRPDADMALLQVQQEMVEVQRFLDAKKKRDRAIKKLCDTLRETWNDKLTSDVAPSDRILIPWINRYGPEEIERAIVLAVPAYTKNRFGFEENRAFQKLLPYVGAVLRNRAQEKESGVIQ